MAKIMIEMADETIQLLDELVMATSLDRDSVIGVALLILADNRGIRTMPVTRKEVLDDAKRHLSRKFRLPSQQRHLQAEAQPQQGQQAGKQPGRSFRIVRRKAEGQRAGIAGKERPGR